MAGAHDLHEEARKDGGQPDDSLFAMRTVLPSLIVLFAVIATGYLILDRLSMMDERMAGFDGRIEQLADQAERAVVAANSAVESADTALTRAEGAEQNAAEAARTREAALESRRAAEAMAAEAEEVARVATEEAGRARADLERLEQERQEELDRLQAALGAIVETRRTALGLVMNFGSDAIEFGFDSADLGGEDRELLSRVAGILLTSSGFSVAVYGHTDDVGTDEYNQTLSERRARSVRDYLVEAGVSPDIVSTLGYGKSSPRDEGTTPEARAMNRRVEIAIIDVNLGPARAIAEP